MQLPTYNAYLERTKADYPDLVKETQEQLDKSTSKAEDLYILNVFWNNFSKIAMKYWHDDSYELWFDQNSMMPMPESVSKQFVNMLFDIRNLNVLYDLGIYAGLNHSDAYAECNPEEAAENPGAYYSKEEVIKNYSEQFADQDEEN